MKFYFTNSLQRPAVPEDHIMLTHRWS